MHIYLSYVTRILRCYMKFVAFLPTPLPTLIVHIITYNFAVQLPLSLFNITFECRCDWRSLLEWNCLNFVSRFYYIFFVVMINLWLRNMRRSVFGFEHLLVLSYSRWCEFHIGITRNVGLVFYCTESECNSFGKCLIKIPYETFLFAFIYARRGTCINAWRCILQRASSVTGLYFSCCYGTAVWWIIPWCSSWSAKLWAVWSVKLSGYQAEDKKSVFCFRTTFYRLNFRCLPNVVW